MASLEDLREALELVEGLPVIGEVGRVLETFFFASLTFYEDLFDQIAEAREALEQLEAQAVRNARLDGMSWDDIADQLDMTRQGLQKRYRATGLEELDALDEWHKTQSQEIGARMRLAIARAERDHADLPDGERQDAVKRSVEETGLFAEMMSLIARQHDERREVVARMKASSNAGSKT